MYIDDEMLEYVKACQERKYAIGRLALQAEEMKRCQEELNAAEAKQAKAWKAYMDCTEI